MLRRKTSIYGYVVSRGTPLGHISLRMLSKLRVVMKPATPKQKDQLIAMIATKLDIRLLDHDILQPMLELSPEDFSIVIASMINNSHPWIRKGEKIVIDLNSDPFVPRNWSVRDHKRGEKFEWNPARVKLYLSEEQIDNEFIEGNKLRKELSVQPVFNANLLDFLLDHQNLIPEEWRGKVICFWGTIYLNSDDRLCVRTLHWDGVFFNAHSQLLKDGFDDTHPTPVLEK